MSSKTTPTPTTDAALKSILSERDQRVLALAFLCFKEEPKVQPHPYSNRFGLLRPRILQRKPHCPPVSCGVQFLKGVYFSPSGLNSPSVVTLAPTPPVEEVGRGFPFPIFSLILHTASAKKLNKRRSTPTSSPASATTRPKPARTRPGTVSRTSSRTPSYQRTSTSTTTTRPTPRRTKSPPPTRPPRRPPPRERPPVRSARRMTAMTTSQRARRPRLR